MSKLFGKSNDVPKLATKEYVDAQSGGAPAWGQITGTLANQTDLNAALGAKVDTVSGKGLSTNDYSNAEKAKVAYLNGVDSFIIVDGDGEETTVNFVKGVSS